MEAEDLHEKLTEVGCYSEIATKHIVRQLVEATVLCYESGVGHRDVKLQVNIIQ